MKFKAGDILVRRRKDGYDEWTYGKKYEVIGPVKDWLYIVDDDGDERVIFENHWQYAKVTILSSGRRL